ncbi:hypothetical protein HAX54_025312, partial [Datura stramonium]|nr:hypothetical protein [Datura stramonium]
AREAPVAWAHFQTRGAIILVHFHGRCDRRSDARPGTRCPSSCAKRPSPYAMGGVMRHWRGTFA